ncbi:MAG: hypothetical protein GY765_11475 [bacterium]|nr:hypothetical protein [bacterium]
MKTKISKTLDVKKITIANLETQDLAAFKGGLHNATPANSPNCADTFWQGCEEQY